MTCAYCEQPIQRVLSLKRRYCSGTCRNAARDFRKIERRSACLYRRTVTPTERHS